MLCYVMLCYVMCVGSFTCCSSTNDSRRYRIGRESLFVKSSTCRFKSNKSPIIMMGSFNRIDSRQLANSVMNWASVTADERLNMVVYTQQ